MQNYNEHVTNDSTMIQLVCYCNSTQLYDISPCIRLTKLSRFYSFEPLDEFGLNPHLPLTALRFYPSLGDDPHHARVSQTFAPMITYATFFV